MTGVVAQSAGESQTMPHTVDSWLFDPTIGKFVAVGIGLVILIVVVKLVQRALGRYVREQDTRYRVRKFVSIIGYLIGVFMVGVIFSDRLGGLTVAFGVAGAGIAFALQEVIASVAGWLAVLMGGFYKTGDRIQLGGIVGDVIDIGVLRTTLMECGQWVKGDLYTGRVVRVANSFVFKEPVFNYSGDFPFLWDEIIVPVRYGSDSRLARKILEDVARDLVGAYAAEAKDAWAGLVRQYMIEDASVEPMISLVANDNWMEFTLRYVVEYKRRRMTKDLLFTRIVEQVETTGGRVALASATFEIVKTAPLEVRLTHGLSGDSER
jgi:small-conductance mechanosensitive channel